VSTEDSSLSLAHEGSCLRPVGQQRAHSTPTRGVERAHAATERRR
jgi:hypothetical protein